MKLGSLGAVSSYFGVEIVALHEIEHILDLQHSTLEGAMLCF